MQVRAKILGLIIIVAVMAMFCGFRTSLAETAAEDKDSFLKQAGEKLKELDRGIDNVKEKGVEIKDETKSEFKKQMTTLQEKRKEADRHLKTLKKTGKKGWEKAKNDFNSAVHDLEGHYNNMIEHFKIKK